MRIIEVSLKKGKVNFSIIGIANIVERSARFQATLNGIPFFEHEDYETVRHQMTNAVNLNTDANVNIN